jgi:predicted transcriptional regulator
METAIKINQLLETIQQRNGFNDQQLAKHVGVSRWTIRRIRKGEIGETISTSLVNVLLQEQRQPLVEQAT